MAHRRFQDGNGARWEVVVRGREWIFEPVEGNRGPARTAPAPGYEKDPYELSIEELQRLLDGAQAPRSNAKKSPFLD